MVNRFILCLIGTSFLTSNQFLNADIMNGVPFSPLDSAVSYDVLVDMDYYDQNYGMIGNYLWDPNATVFDDGNPADFNYDRVIIEISFDFSNAAGFNPTDANLNLLINWQPTDPIQNGQDRIYVHSYDFRDLSQSDIDDYLFNPPDMTQNYHPEGTGKVDDTIGFFTFQINDPQNQNPDQTSIDIDLTNLLEPGTETVQIQMEFVDPDQNIDLDFAQITQYQADWTVIPEPSASVIYFSAMVGLALARRRNIRTKN